MDRTEERMQQRFLDLADAADRRGIVTYTDFMNLNELNIFHNTVRNASFIKWKLFGGYAKAERQLAAFIPDALYLYGEEFDDSCDFPIVCLKIAPLSERFAENLSHRDYLGAILNLGIDRGVIGDIRIDGVCAYVFCLEKMADFLCSSLTRVRHTSVVCTLFEGEVGEIPLHVQQIQGTVASVRLDTLLALAWKASRSSLVKLIEEGQVFVNGKCTVSNGYRVKEDDLISARGLGRFHYKGVRSQTKKGRFLVEIEIYI